MNSKNNTPWIAYKVLAAGAIKPEDGLRHAFSSGADFACVGMFRAEDYFPDLSE